MSDHFAHLRAAVEDQYAVERELGEGGMAHVYLARDLRHNRQVALKVLRPEIASSVGADRFLREIQIAASLQHPNILPLYDSGRADGLLFYTMPYIEEESLRQRLVREKQLPLEDIVAVGRDVAEALSYAHSRGVVHRDIKPENVLLSGEHALVADFGIARAVTEAGGERLTTAGIAVGTPAYMSPEQATGETAIDARSDIYSLGIVVYEMVTGEPPFTGVTAGAILARQASERVPSIEVVRPNVPHEMVEVVEKALAKVPADRYRTAQAFSDALSKGATGKVRLFRPLLRRRRARTVGAALVLVALLILYQLVARWPTGLDPNVIVSFPLEWGGGAAQVSAGIDRLVEWRGISSVIKDRNTSNPPNGEDAAYFIVARLNGEGDFTWVYAGDFLEDRHRDDIGSLRPAEKSALARSQRAAHYVDGRIVPVGSDSVTVVLELHRTARPRTVDFVETEGSIDLVIQLAVQAAAELLLALLPEDAYVDVSDVGEIHPQAIQIMVQAEREFHAGRFENALELYRAAVQADSGFALAGARGAQAASWNHRYEEARDLIGVATRNLEPLTPGLAHFALGFEAYLNGQADSAVAHFEGAIESNPRGREGWMGLGETYQHMLPSSPSPDSLARDAFEQVYTLTDGFAPGLYHLVEFAIRDGDLTRAAALLEEARRGEPDSLAFANLELALNCAENGPDAIDWRSRVLGNIRSVFQEAMLLGVGGARSDCAMAGWRAVLDHDTSTGMWDFSSLVGLQSLLAATGRSEELTALLDSAAATGTGAGLLGRLYYILDALAGADVEVQATAAAASLRAMLPDMRENRLWLLGIWDVHRDRVEEARAIRDTLRSRFPGNRSAALMADALTAHITLADGDTVEAIRQLQALVPNAPYRNLVYPWESLGLQRLKLAEVLIARGDHAEAYRVATTFDTPGAASPVEPVFLPASLALRLRVATELGNEELVERLQERLRGLGRDDLVDETMRESK